MTFEEVKLFAEGEAFVPVGLAAYFLGVSRQRVYELMTERKLTFVTVCGAKFPTLRSILGRLREVEQQTEK